MTFYNQINNQFSTTPANFDQDYYDYFTPAVYFEANDIYTPQPKTEYTSELTIAIDVTFSDSIYSFEPSNIYTPTTKETKEYVTNDYVTIDVENLITFDADELNNIPNQLEIELIDFEEDDNTLNDFYNDCFSIDDVKDIPDYYDLDDCFNPEDILLIPPDLSSLDKLKQELDKLGAWARQSA